MAHHIAIIEDEKEFSTLLSEYLTDNSLAVSTYPNAEDFLFDFNQKKPFDAVIIDWRLPGMSGIELIGKIRLTKELLPIFMSTANNLKEDVLCGLNAGADDYLQKPYNFEELYQRLKNALNKYDKVKSKDTLNEIEIISEGLLLIKNDIKISLTAKEFFIACCLLEKKGQIVSRDDLLHYIYQGEESKIISRNIDVHIVSLRKKINTIGLEIETARGIGYRIR